MRKAKAEPPYGRCLVGMKNLNNSRVANFSEVRSLRLKLAYQLAVGFTLAIAVMLVVVLLFFIDENGMGYANLLQSHWIVQQNLTAGLVVGGLLLTFCIGLISSLLLLYGSLHVAGPLYRIACSLEQATNLEKLRKGRKRDYFKDISTQLEEAVSTLRHYHTDMSKLVDQFELAMAAGNKVQAAEVIVQMKRHMQRVKLA
ncbi:RND multidrug efflux transporter; Acriflavin resistance protein [hydrothermal vent metagenome]|uniref:RND multidrug efflux transporter Acriflavin resistance protein n=1 Tax=hydrothermal vent metagenome TaxID=652676 RepID=A0A3B1BI62_9ZZZZ